MRRSNHTNIDVIGHTCEASYICIWDRSALAWVGAGRRHRFTDVALFKARDNISFHSS